MNTEVEAVEESKGRELNVQAAEEFNRIFKDKVSQAAPAESVFAEAEKIIYGDREQTYGHPAKNLNNIAAQWSLYMTQKYGIEIPLSAEDVCYMMADLKKCRQMNSAKRDNIVDGIGYLGLVQRIKES